MVRFILAGVTGAAAYAAAITAAAVVAAATVVPAAATAAATAVAAATPAAAATAAAQDDNNDDDPQASAAAKATNAANAATAIAPQCYKCVDLSDLFSNRFKAAHYRRLFLTFKMWLQTSSLRFRYAFSSWHGPGLRSDIHLNRRYDTALPD